MKERIQKLLHEYSLSSTKFADQIGVQRSSISHILSGRNKPGFEFLQKLLRHYPEISPQWIILGEGTMYKKQKKPSLPFSSDKPESASRESHIRSEPDPSYGMSNSEAEKIPRQPEKQVKKIVFFYTDHSFEEFHPQDP